jgi:tetratricopeptide (TPR) repeat protein
MIFLRTHQVSVFSSHLPQYRKCVNIWHQFFSNGFSFACPRSARRLALTLSLLGAISPLYGQSFEELTQQFDSQADALENKSEYSKALFFREQQVANSKRFFGSEHSNVASALHNLGNTYAEMNNEKSDASALFFFERALEIYNKNPTAQNDPIIKPNTANTLSCIARIYQKRSDFSKALQFLERALEICETLDSQNTSMAIVLINLGVCYQSLGDYPGAISVYERAIPMCEKLFGRSHQNTATCLHNLANVYVDLGDYEKALPLHERALAIYQSGNTPYDRRGVARSLRNLANLYRLLNNNSKAISMIQKSIEISDSYNGTSTTSLRCLANIYCSSADYAKALPLFEQALEAHLRIDPQCQLIDTADGFNDLAFVLQSIGEYNKALPLYERALAIKEKVLGPQHPNTADSLNNLAVLAYQMGNILSARNYASRQIASKQRELQSILTLDERSRLSWQNGNLSYWAACVLRPEPLAQLVLRRKGVVLDSLMEDRSLASSVQHDSEGRAKLEEIATLRAKLSQIALNEAKQQESTKLQEQIGLLQRSLSTRANLGGRIRQNADITLDTILPAISKGCALVDFIRYEDPNKKNIFSVCYGAVVVGADGSPEFVRIEGATEIDRAIDTLRRSILQGSEAEAESQTRIISEKLWQPVAKKIPEGTKKIFLCPEAKLNFLSFAALLESDGRFVAEKYYLAYLGSARDLARPSSKNPVKTMAIIANPAFELTNSAGAAKDMLTMRSAEVDVFGSITLPPLPGTETEAKALESVAKTNGWQTQTSLRRQATESIVRNSKKPGILHLATHGFYLNSTASSSGEETRGMSVLKSSGSKSATPAANSVDPMRASGVALTGAQATLKSWSQRKAPDPENDGILTAEEVSALDLEGTWLVTLSACETGIGEARSGEGVFGLRRAFMIAGCDNLLMTLWPIGDEAAAKFMADFYNEAFTAGDAAGSLAKVQRDWLVKLRNERSLLVAIRDAGPFAMVAMTSPANPAAELPNNEKGHQPVNNPDQEEGIK